MNLSGVIPPVITPLDEARDLDLASLEKHLERLLASGVDGVFMLGTSGEGPWLRPDQQRAVMDRTVATVAGRVPVIAGVLEPSTVRALEQLEWLESVGVDALAITTPYYLQVDGDAQIEHVERIAEASSLPIVLYNIPQTTHNPMSSATVRHLASLSNVVGIKDSSGDSEHFRALLAIRSDHPAFGVLQGAELQAATALLAGANGVVAGLANLAPELFTGLVAAATSQDEREIEALHGRIESLWQLHTHGHWLSCLKYALHLAGVGHGTTLGLTELPSQAQREIADVCRDVIGGSEVVR